VTTRSIIRIQVWLSGRFSSSKKRKNKIRNDMPTMAFSFELLWGGV
jgi:hypothetical protein